MENLKEKIDTSAEDIKTGPGNFFKYVFNFDGDNKTRFMNMIQYSLLAIIPVILILKITKHVFPEEDDTKGSLEILGESIGQILFLIILIWFTNRIIMFIPTYSGEPYSNFNEITFMIPFLIIMVTMQTKLGAKINTLVERVTELVQGQTSLKDSQNTQNTQQVRVSQPLAQNQQPAQSTYNQMMPPSPPPITSVRNQNDGTTSLNQLPSQQSPNFNQMYAQQTTPLVDAQTPGDNYIKEPMAANEAFGGMFGGTAF